MTQKMSQSERLRRIADAIGITSIGVEDDLREAAESLEIIEMERDHWKRLAHDRVVSANKNLERARKAEARIAGLEGLIADVNALCTEINKRWEASQALADRYEKALREILEPLAAMKQRAEASGRQLSGLAPGIAYSASHLQDIARQALSSQEQQEK